MIIDLDSVGNVPKVIEAVFEPANFDLEGENVELTGPVKFSGEAQLQALRVHIRGTVTADVLFECTRCLEPVAKHLEVPFESVFVDSAYEPNAKELEATDAALDESLVEGGEIDLKEVVREQILLAVPIQIFCREDCKGLCPKCGANLNLVNCNCSDDEIDPRWAALKSLK
jgi:uncharacterized protein